VGVDGIHGVLVEVVKDWERDNKIIGGNRQKN